MRRRSSELTPKNNGPFHGFFQSFYKDHLGYFHRHCWEFISQLTNYSSCERRYPIAKRRIFQTFVLQGHRHLPPTIQTSLKFRDFAELHLLQQISFKLGKFANFKAIFPAVSMDISQLNKLECALEAVWRVFRQLVHAGYSCLNSPNVTIGPFTGHPDNTYINSRQKNKLQRRPLGYVIAVSCFLASFLPNLRIDSNVFDTKDVRTYG